MNFGLSIAHCYSRICLREHLGSAFIFSPPNASMQVLPTFVYSHPLQKIPGNMVYFFFLYLSPNVFLSALSLPRDQFIM